MKIEKKVQNNVKLEQKFTNYLKILENNREMNKNSINCIERESDNKISLKIAKSLKHRRNLLVNGTNYKILNKM